MMMMMMMIVQRNAHNVPSLSVDWNSSTNSCRKDNLPTPNGPVFLARYSFVLNILNKIKRQTVKL